MRRLDVWNPQPDVIDDLAASLELSTSSFVAALIMGAVKKGIAVELAMSGLEEMPPIRKKRRSRQAALYWEPLKFTEGHWETAIWVAGPYHLERQGDVKNARNPAPGDGWYLEGPGIIRTHVGLRRPDAIRRAEELIRITHARSTATPSSEPPGGNDAEH